MLFPFTKIAGFAALTMLGTASLFGAEGGRAAVDVQFKLRAGYAVSTPKDRLDRRTLGLGLEVGYATELGRFAIEAGYQYKSGKQFLTDPSQMETAAGMEVVEQDPVYGKVFVESKKNSLAGLTCRLSYGQVLGGTDWSWTGGLQLGAAKFRQEFIGDVAGREVGGTDLTFEDAYNGTPEKTKVAISPFLGLTYRINAVNSVEFNVLALNYAAIDYRHVAGTENEMTVVKGHTKQDHIVENTRWIPHVEVAYVFRF